MNQTDNEQNILMYYLRDIEVPIFSNTQQDEIKNETLKLRRFSKKYKYINIFLQILPFIVLYCLWYLLLNIVPELIENKLTLIIFIGISHGIIGYSWTNYALHEGAGHGLFTDNKSLFLKFLNFLAFHSSRIMMADPIFYKKIHQAHHKNLGTKDDLSQSHYVESKKIIKSLLPGAGILFPIEYKVHSGNNFSISLLTSLFIGLIRFSFELYFLHQYLSATEIILTLFILSPWIGLTLDRIRETLEHHLMPISKTYGTRELGLAPLSLIIAGGPWGQPCHFTHHLAPDLKWYQQILLSLKIKTILNPDQKNFFGFNDNCLIKILTQAKKQIHLGKIQYIAQPDIQNVKNQNDKAHMGEVQYEL